MLAVDSKQIINGNQSSFWVDVGYRKQHQHCAALRVAVSMVRREPPQRALAVGSKHKQRVNFKYWQRTCAAKSGSKLVLPKSGSEHGHGASAESVRRVLAASVLIKYRYWYRIVGVVLWYRLRSWYCTSDCIIQYSNHEYPYLEPRERRNTVLSVSRNVEESWYRNCKINKKYSMTVGSK